MRTLDEINAEYNQLAAAYGDKMFKLESLQNEVQALKKRVNELSEEAKILAPQKKEGQ